MKVNKKHKDVINQIMRSTLEYLISENTDQDIKEIIEEVINTNGGTNGISDKDIPELQQIFTPVIEDFISKHLS